MKPENFRAQIFPGRIFFGFEFFLAGNFCTYKKIFLKFFAHENYLPEIFTIQDVEAR